MFEKYDGVRGFWNPNTCTMYSRSGKRFSLPPHITDSMPNDMFLDGEMWYVYSFFLVLQILSIYHKVWTTELPRSHENCTQNGWSSDRLEQISLHGIRHANSQRNLWRTIFGTW